MTVPITRLDNDADGLRQHAAGTSNATVTRRLLAPALVLEGHSRAAAAKRTVAWIGRRCATG